MTGDERGSPEASDAARRRFLATIGRSRRQGYTPDAAPVAFRLGAPAGPEGEASGVHSPPGDDVELRSGWSGPEVCAIVGISSRQLDYWTRTELLTPSISQARPGGVRLTYSFQDLLEAKVMKRLLDSGASLQSVRKAAGVLREAGVPLAEANLVLQGSDALVVRSGEEIVDLLRGGQGVLNVLPLAGVEEELREMIEEVAGRRRWGASADQGPSPHVDTA